MNKSENYEWWVDIIQDCIAQIAGRYDLLNPHYNACHHICDETYIDFHFYFDDCIVGSSYYDFPEILFEKIQKLKDYTDYETDECKALAKEILGSDYFRNRPRWDHGYTSPNHTAHVDEAMKEQ
jgi:hypothetical protein